MNLGWSYDERATDLFRRIDRDGWEFEGRDPALMLSTESQDRLDTLASDAAFTSLASVVRDQLRATLDDPRWFQTEEIGLGSVGYFSPEFGIAAALPQYSGGLGVLAGDHLKAANDLGLPLTGIGLFYRHGYFRQELDGRGWQQERFPRLDPRAMALRPVKDVKVGVELAGVRVYAALWEAQIGGVSLYLLDTDIDENDDEAPTGLRSPLRRRPRGAHPPGDRPRHRRHAGAARPRQGPRGLPPERGPRRVPGPRAHPPGHARRRPRRSPRPAPPSAPPRSSPRTRRCRPASTASPASSWRSTSPTGAATAA